MKKVSFTQNSLFFWVDGDGITQCATEYPTEAGRAVYVVSPSAKDADSRNIRTLLALTKWSKAVQHMFAATFDRGVRIGEITHPDEMMRPTSSTIAAIELVSEPEESSPHELTQAQLACLATPLWLLPLDPKFLLMLTERKPRGCGYRFVWQLVGKHATDLRQRSDGRFRKVPQRHINSLDDFLRRKHIQHSMDVESEQMQKLRQQTLGSAFAGAQVSLSEDQIRILRSSLDEWELEFSARLDRCMRGLGCIQVWQIIEKWLSGQLTFPGFGDLSLVELHARLAERELALDMYISPEDWERITA